VRFNLARASDSEKPHSEVTSVTGMAPTDVRISLMSGFGCAFTEARAALDLSAKRRGKEGIGRMNAPGRSARTAVVRGHGK
jgi:hypothetical protein